MTMPDPNAPPPPLTPEQQATLRDFEHGVFGGRVADEDRRRANRRLNDLARHIANPPRKP